MPLLAPVTTTTLSASFRSMRSLGGKTLLETGHHVGPRLFEVRLGFRPIVAVAIAEIAQRDLGAIAGQRLEIQVHERTQRPNHGKRRRRVPFEHKLLHRRHAVRRGSLAAARALWLVEPEP